MSDAGQLDSSHEPPEWEQWSRLLMSYFDGEETAVALAGELKNSLELRRMFVEVSLQRVALRRVFGKSAFQPEEPISVTLPGNRSLVNHLWGKVAATNRPVVWSVLACGALFAIYFVAISWGIFSEKLDHSHLADTNLKSEINNQKPEIESVATLTATDDCQWQIRGEPVTLRAGMNLFAKDTMNLLAGTAEITFADGVTVVLEGPATFVVQEPGRGKLDQGKLVAKVPQGAIGFTVNTPSAEVIDLGTEFGVQVDALGDSDVQVFQGTVDLILSPSNSAAGKQLATKRLSTGEAAKVRAATAEFSDVTFVPDKFVRQAPVAKPRYGARKFIDLKQSATARQSSEYLPDKADLFRAHHAVDGDYTTFSHTDPADTAPWWQVDLGSMRAITTVILNNRQKYTLGRLRDLTIKILAEDGEQVLFTSPLLNKNNELGAGERDFNRGPEQIVLELVPTHGKPVEGRFVRVERTVTDLSENLGECNVLSLAEVQIIEATQLSERSQPMPDRPPEALDAH